MNSETNFKDERERERIELERQRLELEKEKLKLERERARWAFLSVFVPLLVLAMTFLANVWIQAKQAQNDFELRAAEIVMDTESPSATRNRAEALAALFPGRLPSGFAGSFDPGLYAGNPPLEPTVELFRQLVAQMDQKQEILALWNEVFRDGPYYFSPDMP